MKISVITMVGHEKRNVYEREDPFDEAMRCYLDFADEVIIINGSHDDIVVDDERVKIINRLWPYEWNWRELPIRLNEALGTATGDWVVKMDIDYLLHESDVSRVRTELEGALLYDRVSFQKFNVISKDRASEKGAIPICINKGKVGDRIQFGRANDMETDLCYPIYVGAAELVEGVPTGTYKGPIHKSGIKVWNYDYSFKDIEVAKDEFWRGAKAYHEYFGNWQFGSDENEAFRVFLDGKVDRYKRAPHRLSISDHPKYIRDRVENAGSELFIHSGWGNFRSV